MPAVLEARLIFADVTPGIFVLLLVAESSAGAGTASAGWSIPCPTCPTSMRFGRTGRGASQALIAARLLNYEEIVATLPPNSERQLVEQIVARLKVGASDRVLYQGDGGIFAWFEEPGRRSAITSTPSIRYSAIPRGSEACRSI